MVYRPTAISATSMGAIGYGYDAAGRRTSMTDDTGTTSYGYNAAGRLTGVSAPVTGTVGYSYDNANRLTGLSYPGGRQVTYSYETRGLLAGVADAGGVGASYTYDAAGRRTGTTPANGMPPSVYAYDNADRLTSITHTYLDASNVLQQLAIGYTYDNAGNKLTMSDNRATPAGTTTYTYDALDRLTAVVDPASAITSYGYDAAGNRTSVTTGGSTVTSTFDALNRLLGDTSGASYTYDANGNQLTRTAGGVTTTYSYDTLDRMTGLTGGPHSAVYTYNGDGLRVAKAVDGGAAVYQTWAALGQPQVIRDGTTDYLWSSEVIAQVPMGGTAQYAQGDGLGSTRQITDNTGHVVGSQQYDAYGAPQQQTGVQAQPTPGWSIGFTGQQMDAESGLVYLRARYYNPESGQLLSQDAVGSPGNYVYANNNPTRFTDPSGQSPEDQVGTGCRADDDACLEALRARPRYVIRIGFYQVLGVFMHAALWIILPGGGSKFFEGFAENAEGLRYLFDAGKLRAELRDSTIFPFAEYVWNPDPIADFPDGWPLLESLTEFASRINGADIDYAKDGPNSNSVIWAALQALGIPRRGDLLDYFPDETINTIFGPQPWLQDPGWNNSVTEALRSKCKPPKCITS